MRQSAGAGSCQHEQKELLSLTHSLTLYSKQAANSFRVDLYLSVSVPVLVPIPVQLRLQ
jgi:hypothetical protein